MITTRLAISKSVDPWYNLALEEYLLKHVRGGEVILYLWQNNHTVVIGKHQNAWQECDCKLLEQDEGRLARRLSGGGAVYHDLGNLNFTMVMDRKLYDLEKQLTVILQAVRGLGIGAEFTGRNDLTIEGRKFSGNAFCFKSERAYHHGTLMVDTDLECLTRYLHAPHSKLTAKGAEIASVRSRVVNLTSIRPGLAVPDLKDAMKDSFTAAYGRFAGEVDLSGGKSELDQLYRKYASWEWIYGETPAFDATISRQYNWGKIEIGLVIMKGIVDSAVVYSDAIDCDLIESLAGTFKGLPFDETTIWDVVEKAPSFYSLARGRSR